MTVYEIYSRPACWNYKASLCTKAFFFILITLLLTFIPPLLIAYRSQGFWKVTNTYMEQPNVRFKKQLILVLNLPQPGEYLAWSTYSNLNNLLQSNLRIPVVSSIETDTNGDGKFDQLNFTASVPLTNTESVTSFQLLLVFDYQLFRMSTFQMETLAFASHSSVSGGSSFTSFGNLRLDQKTPLRHRGVDTRFNTTIIDSSSLAVSTYDFVNIFRSYSARNVTTQFTNDYSIWKSGRGTTQPFIIQTIINYPTEVIVYQPGFWELIKWGWVQYVSILLIFLWVFQRINYVVFGGQLLNTIVEAPKLKQS